MKELKIKTYKIAILPVALYGCETWSRSLSLTLRKENRPRFSENRVLRRKKDRGEKCMTMNFVKCILHEPKY
jgi:hypothetical protein